VADSSRPGASRNSSTDAELVKVTLNLPRSVLQKVERLAEAHGLNKTTVIRRAIELEDFLDSITRGGGKILVKEAKGDMKEVIFR
jgi:hypothetical protein